MAGQAGSSAFVARYRYDGSLDPSFGTDGVLRTTMGGAARFTGMRATSMQSGQVVLSGVVAGPAGSDGLVARVNTAGGTLDPTFGTGGVTVADLGGAADLVTGVELSHYGKAPGLGPLVVAGGDGSDMVVATFARDGGAAGVHRASFGRPAHEWVTGSVRLPDGKTVVVADRAPGSPFLARLLADGRTDPTFGDGGVVDPGLGGASAPGALARAPDGRLLVDLRVANRSYVVRFLPDGTLDTSFGVGGFAEVSATAGPATLTPLADGRVLVRLSGALFRVTADGRRDNSFGTNGAAVLPSGGAAVVPLPDGTVLAFGYSESFFHKGLQVDRIAPDGTVSFGWNGAIALHPTSVLRLADGRIVVAGSSGDPTATSSDTMVASYLPSGAPDPSFSRGGAARLDLARTEPTVHLTSGLGGSFVLGTNTVDRSSAGGVALARLLPDGRVDRTFAKGGGTGLGLGASLHGLAVQADGKVVTSLTLTRDNQLDVALARFTPSGSAVVGTRAWGWNPLGQVGDGSKTDRFAAVAPRGLANLRDLGGGWYHSAAALDDGSVWAWGWNGLGQLGTVSGADSLVPARVDGLPNVVAVAAGAYHTLALAADGTVWAWGWNGVGQLGIGSTTPATSSRPVKVPIDRVTAIAVGWAHSLAVRDDGTVWSWGWNAYGQLGDGSATDQVWPTQAYWLGERFVEVAAGAMHTLGVTADGKVYAWGWNGVGQLGAGRPGDAWIPTPVAGLDGGVARVAAGGHHSLAAKANGTVYAWGWNVLGQLGDGTTTDRGAPVRVAGLSGVGDVAAGTYHSLALAADGTVSAWGWNGLGQLGDGTVTERHVPVRATRVVDATVVAAGAGHSIAG